MRRERLSFQGGFLSQGKKETNEDKLTFFLPSTLFDFLGLIQFLLSPYSFGLLIKATLGYHS